MEILGVVLYIALMFAMGYLFAKRDKKLRIAREERQAEMIAQRVADILTQLDSTDE